MDMENIGRILSIPCIHQLPSQTYSIMRVLVLGGYGNFGSRICRALTRNTNLEIMAGGRDPERGHRDVGFEERIGKAKINYLDVNFQSTLRKIRPDLVVHCIGPFQGQDYRVALATLDINAHYIDLADGRDFVAQFSRAVNTAAMNAKKLAISGASTVPALSSAVVDELIPRFKSLEEIQISIAPGQRAPRGVATMQAVFSYAGKRFNWLKDGAWQPAYGWQELRRLRFADFGKRWAAACDVPDLELFPERYLGVKTVQFRAALELGVQHLVLWVTAQLRRIGIPVPLEHWAPTLNCAASLLDRFGSETGGMLVSITGVTTNGKKGRAEWHLTADDSHGPEIPAMSAILLVEKIARGEIRTHGAMPCMGLLTLNDFKREFARWHIRTNIEEYSS